MNDLTNILNQYKKAHAAYQDFVGHQESRSRDEGKAKFREARESSKTLISAMMKAIDKGPLIFQDESGKEIKVAQLAALTADGMQYYATDEDAQYCNLGVNLSKITSIQRWTH